MKKNDVFVYLLILIVAAISVVIVGITINYVKNNKGQFDKMIKYNSYTYEDDKKEEVSGTLTRTNDSLIKEHCFDGICLSEVTIYYVGNNGRVEYKLLNKNKDTKSGTLKMNFGDRYLVVIYEKLKFNKKVSGTSYYGNLDLSNVNDYRLEKLSKKEESRVVK